MARFLHISPLSLAWCFVPSHVYFMGGQGCARARPGGRQNLLKWEWPRLLLALGCFRRETELWISRTCLGLCSCLGAPGRPLTIHFPLNCMHSEMPTNCSKMMKNETNVCIIETRMALQHIYFLIFQDSEKCKVQMKNMVLNWIQHLFQQHCRKPKPQQGFVYSAKVTYLHLQLTAVSDRQRWLASAACQMGAVGHFDTVVSWIANHTGISEKTQFRWLMRTMAEKQLST